MDVFWVFLICVVPVTSLNIFRYHEDITSRKRDGVSAKTKITPQLVREVRQGVDVDPLDSKLDIHGDLAWATQAEDNIALKIFERWLTSTGGEEGMNCDNLRLVTLAFAEAPLDWEELSEDAVDLAKKEDNKWPNACEDIDDVKGCRKALAALVDMDEINDGFEKINNFVEHLKEGQQQFNNGVTTKTCKKLLFQFIDQTFHFKTNIQEAISCMPEMPECQNAIRKHKAIYQKRMYQSMRKGRAKSKEAKKAAADKLGDQSDRTKYPIKSRTAGISMEPENTIEKLKNFFSHAMIHGKRFMQRDVSESKDNPAMVFKLSNAPFIGGLSGSILEIYRLIDAYAGKKYELEKVERTLEKVDDDMALLFMALLDLGGHHSITETAIATQEWGLLQHISVPFKADSDLNNMDEESIEQLPKAYKEFLLDMNKFI